MNYQEFKEAIGARFDVKRNRNGELLIRLAGQQRFKNIERVALSQKERQLVRRLDAWDDSLGHEVY